VLSVNIVLIVHTFLMGMAGGLFIFFPGILILTDDNYALMMGRSFGVACVTQGLLSGLTYSFKHYLHARQVGYATLSLFHVGTFAIQLMAWVEGLLPIPVAVFHLIFASTFIFLTIKNRK
jgi:hypothetical protein